MTSDRRINTGKSESLREQAILRKVRTYMPATVVSYSSATNRATVRLERLGCDAAGNTFEEDPIEDLPVVWMTGGGMTIRMALSPGDDCGVLVSDRSLALWKEGQRSVNPCEDNPGILFDPVSAVVIPGLESRPPSALKPFDGVYIGRQDESLSVRIPRQGTAVSIGSGLGASLAAKGPEVASLLTSLATAISSSATGDAVPAAVLAWLNANTNAIADISALGTEVS